MFFATSILHVHLMQWDDESTVERAVTKCNEVWESLDPQKVCSHLAVVIVFYIAYSNSYFL